MHLQCAPVMDWHDEECLVEDVDPFGMAFGCLGTLLSEDNLASICVEQNKINSQFLEKERAE